MIPHLTRQRDGTAPAFPSSFLERICSLPRRFATFEDWQRYWHLDVPLLDDADLGCEYRRAQRRADYESDAAAAAWLAGRLDAIAHERARRSRGRVRRAEYSAQREGGTS